MSKGLWAFGAGLKIYSLGCSVRGKCLELRLRDFGVSGLGLECLWPRVWGLGLGSRVLGSRVHRL